MLWIQSTDAPILSDTNIWAMLRDGKPTKNLPLPTVGFRVIKPFTAPTRLKSRFLPGMQGQALYHNKVRVMVQGLFDADGNFLEDWIHEDCIHIGAKLYDTWKMDLCNVPRTPSRFTSEELGELKDPKHRHLARGISTFLIKLAEAKPQCLTEETHKRLGGVSGNKVLWITNMVIKGVEKAGLLSVLNDPHFTIQAIRDNSNLDCKHLAAQGETGFYLRIYSKVNPGQSKKHGSMYVGQAKDLYRRCGDWSRPGQTQHTDLIQESDTIEMRTICRLDMTFYQDHKYIIEQLFTSLFQTYKPGLANQKVRPKGGRDNYHIKAYLEMDKIATVSANESGWTGAVQRDSFWKGSFSACEGLNSQSPISEAPMYEPWVWLESRGYMQDPKDPGSSIPISNFTSQVPKKMTIQTPSAKAASKNKSFIIFDLKTDYKSETKKGYTWRTTRVLPKDFASDGLEWPAENSFSVTFEVRTDWKPHPYSWARLPLIGPFEDWDRANSWAMSISWVDASGQDRLKYLHCETPYMMLNKESMGSIQPYARGIEVIHWLFNERIPSGQQHRWLQTPPMAAVKVIQHNHVRQLITLEAGKGVTTTVPIPSNRKSKEDILKEMQGKGVHGYFGLDNVGRTLANAKKATTGKWPRFRDKCDCCVFYNRGTNTIGCTFKDGNTVCESCLWVFGRPACSWTLHIPPTSVGNTFKDLALRGDTASALIRKALHGIEGSTGDSLSVPDPQMMEIDQEGDELEGQAWEWV